MTKSSKSGLNIREWVRDRVIFLGLIIFLVGGVSYISAGKLFDTHSIWLHPVKEFSLLFSLIGIVSFGYEIFLRELTFKEYKDALQEIVNPDAVRLGIKGIYKNRSELGNAATFEKLFKKVKREIFIGGTSLLSISTSSRELLREKVLSGIDVKLLLMAPNSPVVDLIMKRSGGNSTFVNEIETSLLLLRKLKQEIENEKGKPGKGQFLVHTYDTIPSHSFISVDEGDSSGFIIADIGPYLGRSHPRPSMMVTNKKHGLYEYWQEMNEGMWEESQSLDISRNGAPDSKTNSLVLTSGKETQYFDIRAQSWLPASICQMDGSWRAIKGSQWVWIRDSVTLEEAKTGSQSKFRLTFDIPPGKENSIVRADLYLRSDDTCHLTVNDVGLNQEYGGADYPDPFLIDIDKYLKGGENTMYFELISFAKPDADAPEDNPTGLIYRLHVEYREQDFNA